MKLLELQQFFVLYMAWLIEFAYAKGYKMTCGESYDDDGIGHMKNSLHYVKLAADFNLFKDGKWLTKTEDHKLLGKFWENVGKADGVPTRWGGRWGDGNHYSIEYQGRK